VTAPRAEGTVMDSHFHGNDNAIDSASRGVRRHPRVRGEGIHLCLLPSFTEDRRGASERTFCNAAPVSSHSAALRAKSSQYAHILRY